MKAYDAFSSWATMVTRGSPREEPARSARPSQLQCGFRGDPFAHRDDAAADRSADGQAVAGRLTPMRGPALSRRLRDQLFLAQMRQLQRGLVEIHHVLTSFLSLVVIRLGVFLVDVVVERAAGVGHEHVFEAG